MGTEKAPWVELVNGDWSGRMRLRVRGRSMWPTLRPDDLVTVEPATPSQLRLGDWVLLRALDELFLHRFLGFTADGRLRAKGDGHRIPDAPWSPEALVGRAVTLSRQGQTYRVSSSSVRELARTMMHGLMTRAWTFLRRIGLVALILTAATTAVKAAVTLLYFEASAEGRTIQVAWATASEIDMLGFYVQRSLQAGGEYQRISALIPAVGDLVGAFYEHTDQDVAVGVTYYYRLESLETTGSTVIYGPVLAMIAPPATDTSTPSPTPTPTNTPPPPFNPSPVPSATSTPSGPLAPSIEFWADSDRIVTGDCTGLNWRTENVKAVYYQGHGVVGSGGREECPRQTTTYVLSVLTGQDEQTREITIHVQEASPLPSSSPTPSITPSRSSSNDSTPDAATAGSSPPSPTAEIAAATTPRSTSSVPAQSPILTPETTLSANRTPLTAETPGAVRPGNSSTVSPAVPVTRTALASADSRTRQSDRSIAWMTWWLVLALIGVGIGVVLLGGGGIWLMRRRQ